MKDIISFIWDGKKWVRVFEPIDDKFVVPDYPYWLLAYVITPEVARELVNKGIEQNIIPVDEYVPKCYHSLMQLHIRRM